MSHQILKHDKQFGRTMAWHGLTDVLPDLKITDPEFYLKGWEVEIADVKLTMADGTTLENDGAGAFQCPVIISCKHDAEISPLNPIIVGKPFAPGSYSVINNARFMELIEKSLSEAGIAPDVESVGSVFDRSRTFVSIPLPSMESTKIGEREFKFFLNFINSFDGSTPLLANVSNICTVCNNTLTFNLEKGGYLIKHTKNALSRLDRLPEVIAEAVKMQREFANEFMKLESEKCTASEAEAFFAGFTVGDGEAMSVNAKNRTETLLSLFSTGKGNKGMTYADVLSSITDFYTHQAASGADDSQAHWKNAVSSEFGAGQKAKARAFSILTVPGATKGAIKMKSARKAMIERGTVLLKDYAKRESELAAK